MATNFPVSIDNYTNPAPTDDVSIVVHSTQHANHNDSIEAIEAKLGITNSADTASIDYLLKSTSSLNPGHKHNTLDGLTASITELNYTDGVTSAIQTQLDAKQATLVSGTNIKTINSTSLLGSGNITIASGVSIGDTIGSGTATRILYLGASNVLAQTGSTVYLSSDNLYFDQTGTGNSQSTKAIYFKPTFTDGNVYSTFGIYALGVGGNSYPELVIGGTGASEAKIRIRSLTGAGETIYFKSTDLDFGGVTSAITMPKLFLASAGENPPGSEKFFIRSTSNIVLAIFEQADPNANPVEITYIHNNPWTGGASNGAFQSIRLRTDTTDRMLAANWTATWATATHASRKGRATFNVYDTAIREAIRIEASGSAAMVGFYGVAAVTQPTALTTQLTTITATAPGTPDYAIQDLTNVAGYGFVTADEGQSFLKVVLNLQTRVAELETKLQALGLVA